MTLSRYALKVTAALGNLPLKAQPAGCLIVDTPSVRVGSPCRDSYSGHKHQRCGKVRLICDEQEGVVAVGRAWPGSVHDKTIFNAEGVRQADTLKAVMPADKAYVGANEEGVNLLRPIKRNEKAWRSATARDFNRELGRRRVKVEHVFARLKTFKVLQGLFPYRLEKLGNVIRALAVVHNFNREVVNGATG